MKISYAIPVCNEHQELERLLRFLISHKHKEDEIVVLCDEGNTTTEVLDVLEVHEALLTTHHNPLNRDFAQQKNYLNSKCTGDWIFLIDADEVPTNYIIKAIPTILESNPEVEAYWIPRINTVSGLTEDHTATWGWSVDEKGWVNFPDYQMRLYKNSDRIRWVNPVHEQITGFTKFAHLPKEEEFCLYHPKGIERQEMQNKFYETL